MKSFRGKVVVITGAASGIGRATAIAFATEGAKVCCADRDGEGARRTADQIGGDGFDVDVADADAVEKLAVDVYAKHGRVDVLHNNAGIGHGAPIEETTLEDWQKVLSINLFGVVHGIHAFVPRMLQQGGRSHIVNTASGLGLIAVPGMAPYCASKFAVVGLSESLAVELADRDIGVSVICPGIINTNIVKTARMSETTEQKRDMTMRLYQRHGATPESVAQAVLRAVKKRQVVVPTPALQVTPVWWIKRVWGGGARYMAKGISRRFLGE